MERMNSSYGFGSTLNYIGINCEIDWIDESTASETKEFYIKINAIIAVHATKHLSGLHGSIEVGPLKSKNDRPIQDSYSLQ